jgi:hypothetical protein
MSQYDVPPNQLSGVNSGGTTGWYGWIAFAATIMIINGGFNLIQGLVALVDDEWYVATANGLVTFDLTAWGWIHLLFGLLLIAVGFALFTEQVWATIAAIIIVSLNMFSQFAFMSAYPVWSIIAIAVDVLVLWALLVHGGEDTV